MAGVNWGEALAQGIAQGVGEGAQDYFRDQRRERMELRQMDKSFDMFKKQQRYQMGLQGIASQNEALGNWETAAKMNVGDLAYQAAVKMAEPLSKEERGGFIRDTMKNFSGMSKAELLVRAGYSKPDYSQWIDNPEYQDAIPMGRVANMEDMPDMTQTFKYDPRRWEQEQKKVQEKLTDYDKKKRDEFSSIRSMSIIQFGARPSEELTNAIWKNRPDDKGVVMKGAEAVSLDQNLLTSLINSGQVVQVGSTLKFKYELSDSDRAILGESPQAQQETSQAQPGALYTEPSTKAYLDKQEQEKKTKQLDSGVQKMAKELSTGAGSPLTSYTELSDSLAQLDSMNPDALDYLFQAGFSTAAVRDLAAKFGNEDAQAAKNLISKLSSTVNAIRHDLFGSALTEGEAEKFKEQFADIGLMNNKENLRTQINNLISKTKLAVTEKSSGFSPEIRGEFLKRNPAYQGLIEGGEIGQVSDSSKQAKFTNAQGQDVTSTIPDKFWTASPEKQKQFLEHYHITMGGM